MVAGGEDIGAHVKKLFRDLRRNPESTGGILGVDDREFDIVRFAYVADVLAHNAAASATEDVTYEEDVQEGSSFGRD